MSHTTHGAILSLSEGRNDPRQCRPPPFSARVLAELLPPALQACNASCSEVLIRTPGTAGNLFQQLAEPNVALGMLGALGACCACWAVAMPRGELPATTAIQYCRGSSICGTSGELRTVKHGKHSGGAGLGLDMAQQGGGDDGGAEGRDHTAALGPELWAEVLKRVPESDRRVAASKRM